MQLKLLHGYKGPSIPKASFEMNNLLYTAVIFRVVLLNILLTETRVTVNCLPLFRFYQYNIQSKI